jgi:hypothetical protein
MSAKRIDRLNQPPQVPKGVEGTLKSNSGQKNRRDGGDLVEGVRGLFICRDERRSSHRAIPSGEQPERSQIPIHAHATPSTIRSRKQSSSRTGAAARPQPTTLASTTPSTAGRTHAGSKPDSLGVKKGGGTKAGNKAGVGKVGAKPSKPTSTDVKKRTRGSKRWGRCRLRIIINNWINNWDIFNFTWSLFLDCDDGQNVHMKISTGPGHQHYQEIRNIPEPDPDGLVKNIHVTEFDPAFCEDILNYVGYVVPIPPHNHIHPTRLWVMDALNGLVNEEFIDVNVDQVMAAADAPI